MNSRIRLGVMALSMIGASSLVSAEDYGGAKLAMNTKESFGQYLTDSGGRALYVLEEDKRGQSTCYETCAEVWPPFVTMEKAIEVQDVDKGLIGIIERKDGLMQVTYQGKPLYYYTKDKGQPGSTKGHEIHDQFGEWYLVAPTGKEVGLSASYQDDAYVGLAAVPDNDAETVMIAPAAAEPVAPCVKTNVKNFKNACPQ
jgi:predicted lipoprotein with Yx(FWY)xxD motif